MLTKSDCMSILVRIDSPEVDANPYIRKLAMAKDLPIDVLKFIAQNRGMEAVGFYEMLRRKHNKSKDKLYTNIIRGQEDPDGAVITLSCLLTQIVLYGSKLDGTKEQFFKEIRAEEVSRVLNEYFKAGNAEECLALLKLVKTDLLVIEYLSGRRELE